MVKKASINIANALSLARIFLGPVFMIAVFKNRFTLAVFILLLATLTDFLDGQIARTWKMQTRVGKMLDPLADKIIVFFAVLTLLIKLDFPLWVGLIIISRDLILLMGSAIFLIKYKQKFLVPLLIGKISTFFQFATIIAFTLNTGEFVRNLLIILTVIFTVASAIVYLIKGYYIFFTKKAPKGINLPNQISILRIIFIPVFIAFLMSDVMFKEIVAAGIFIILATSDALDGYIARKKKLVTNFGKIIDPIADKFLITSALIFLIGRGIETWMAVVIIVRELSITILRMFALRKNIVIAAKFSGKLKTITQIVAISAVLLNNYISFSYELMVLAVLITVYSGIEYIIFAYRSFIRK